jgi:dienelactone hydrolase
VRPALIAITRCTLIAAAGAGCDSAPAAPPSDGSIEPDAAIAPSVRCSAFTVTGTPTTQQGATWVYRSTDADGVYDLSGILLAPSGAGPFPAVIVSHGYGGSAGGYSKMIATTMRDWGTVAIATNYTHAAMPAGSPTGDVGASPANLARGWKVHQLLSCMSGVDVTRVAAHGHSMGAFVTSGLLAYHPTGFLVASHTAGGVNDAPPGMDYPSLGRDEAATIVTPYQLHHGDADVVVPLRMDELLDGVLTEHGVEHELHVYPGYDHPTMARDATMLARVRTWYTAHDLF